LDDHPLAADLADEVGHHARRGDGADLPPAEVTAPPGPVRAASGQKTEGRGQKAEDRAPAPPPPSVVCGPWSVGFRERVHHWISLTKMWAAARSPTACSAPSCSPSRRRTVTGPSA